MKKQFFLLICILLLCGCNNRKDPYAFPKQFTLNGEVYDNDIVMVPMGIFTKDSLLIVISRNINKGFGQVFNLHNHLEKVAEFGTIGQGPGEFIIPELTHVQGDYFYLHNLNAREIAKWKIHDDQGDILPHEISRLRFDRIKIDNIGTQPRGISPIGDRRSYVGIICDPKQGYFTIFDNTQPSVLFGKPPVEEDNVPFINYAKFLNGRLDAYENSFAFCCMNIPYIAYYTLEKGDSVPTLQWEDRFGKTSYFIENESIRFGDDAPGLNRHVEIHEKYIYVLHINTLMNQIDFNYTDKSEAKQIFVYNKKGKRIAKLNLDYGLFRYCVSEDEKTIYGTIQNPDYQIVRYDIPELE